MSDKKSYLLWLDLETTGLDPRSDTILEVGAVLTDMDLNEVDRYQAVVATARSEALPLMNNYVIKMHANSGLLDDLWTSTGARTAPLKVIEKEILENLIGDLTMEDIRVYLAGSSIHFDRAFIKNRMPLLDDVLSHRMLDVSVYKIAFPDMLQQPESGAEHRVMSDINYSMDQQRQMNRIMGDVLDLRAGGMSI